MSLVNASRRRFIKSSAIAGGGLIIGFSLNGCSSGPPPLQPMAGAFEPNAFLQITPENMIRFYCPRDEMGQGVTTGLTTLIAEELDVVPGTIDIALAGPHSDYNNPNMGVQATGGSNSLKAHYLQLRQVGANVRAVLLEAAAADLDVPVARLRTEDAHIVADGTRHPYGKFVVTAAALQPPTEAPMKADADFRYIGKDFPRLDCVAKATGTAQFGIDVDIPNLHRAVVKRPPVAGGTVTSFDAAPILAMPGVTDVVEIGSGVAVVAERFWQAKKGATALQVEWDLPELAAASTASIKADYKQSLDETEGQSDQEEGDLTGALARAQNVLEEDYWAPYLAHAPMEPMNAVVRIENGEAEVWTGSQGVGGVQGLVARTAGLDKEKVRACNTYLGGGFGRRATLTHVVETTQIALAANKPIQLLWTREDDIRNGIYRPASLMRIKAGVDEQGLISAWHAKRVGGDQTPYTLSNMLPGLLPTAVSEGVIDWMVDLSRTAFDSWVIDPTSIEGLFEDYDWPNRAVNHVTVDHGLPLTFWRSVGHSYTAFAKESMVDELALTSGIDAVELRLRNTQNNPRLHNVIQVAGERMKQMQPGPGRSFGFAAHGSFGTDVAEIAEVSVENGKISVHKVVCVVDCGKAVNPDVVRAQMEGGVMFGLTAALHGNLELENGAIKESNFHDYPILRMNEAPEVEVIIVDSGTAPTGVGEPGLPPIAPAVANAVFAASGQRLRSLPLKLV